MSPSYPEIMAEKDRQRRAKESASSRLAEARAEDEINTLHGIRDSLEKRVKQAEETARRADARALAAEKESSRSFLVSVAAVAVSVVAIIVSVLVR